MNTAAQTDRDQLNGLLERSGRKDQQAFADLYSRTSPKLFGVCLRMLRDRGSAEEVLQEIWITVWNRAESFDPARASAITWLVTLSRNKAIDRLRQRREETSVDPSWVETTADDGPTPAADAQTSEEHARLRRCLDALEKRQQDAVREAFFSGVTYNQLAARCSVPLGTMKSWIRRGLLQLRACLET